MQGTGDLADLKRQLHDVAEELASTPAHMVGSEKHVDRVREAEWLVKAIARLEKAAAVRQDLEGRVAHLRREIRGAGPSRFGTAWLADREREVASLEGRLALMK